MSRPIDLFRCSVDGRELLRLWLHPWPEADPLPAFGSPLVDRLTHAGSTGDA